jgi:hypothetical protein
MKWEGSDLGLIYVIFPGREGGGGGGEARVMSRETLVGVPSEFRTGNVPNTNFERCHYRKLPGKCFDVDSMHIKINRNYVLCTYFKLSYCSSCTCTYTPTTREVCVVLDVWFADAICLV